MRSPVVALVMVVAGLAPAWPGLALGQPQPHRPPPPAVEDADRAPDDRQTEPTTPIPPLTDADRDAAFPDVGPHPMRDRAVHTFVLLDQLEWQEDQSVGGVNWDAKGWIGRDLDRIWFRSEGDVHAGDVEDAEAHVLYGRAIARWWDVVAGVRQNLRPGPAQTWAAFGVQGLAPYWFEVEATGYVSDAGQVAARFEAEYELLLTNRLVVRPLVEINLYGKSNVARGIGAGLTTTNIGLRVRYEVRREVAPYIGVTWDRMFGETRGLAEAVGDTASRLRFIGGVRLWY